MPNNDLSEAAAELGLTAEEWLRMRKDCEFGRISILTRSGNQADALRRIHGRPIAEDQTDPTPPI